MTNNVSIVFFSAKAWTWLDVVFKDVEKYNFQLCNKTIREYIEEKWISKRKPASLLYYISVLFPNTGFGKRLGAHFKFLAFDKKKLIGNDTIFIFFNACVYEKDELFRKLLRKKYPNAKMLFLVDDSKSFRESNKLEYLRSQYDDVMSVNMMDSIDLGTYYYQEPLPARIVDSDIKTDLFFIGTDRGRRERLENLADFLTERGLILDFIFCTKSVGTNPTVKYVTHEIEYSKLQEMMDETNCILEIAPADSRVATTMRAVEAVAYGKKLLTSNPLIKYSPMYNPNQMKVFNDLEDIDVEWLKSKDKKGFSNPQSVSPIATLDALVAHYCGR